MTHLHKKPSFSNQIFKQLENRSFALVSIPYKAASSVRLIKYQTYFKVSHFINSLTVLAKLAKTHFQPHKQSNFKFFKTGLSFFKIYFHFMCMCVCVHTPCGRGVPVEARGIRSSGAGVTVGQHRHWEEENCCPLEDLELNYLSSPEIKEFSFIYFLRLQLNKMAIVTGYPELKHL